MKVANGKMVFATLVHGQNNLKREPSVRVLFRESAARVSDNRAEKQKGMHRLLEGSSSCY